MQFPFYLVIEAALLCCAAVIFPIPAGKRLQALDSISLYVPPAFALSRVVHLISGCDWGRHISMHLCGFHLSFRNPVPLYALAVDVGIYLFLRQLYTVIYSGKQTRERYRGTIIGACLMLHGATGVILGVFTAEGRWILDLAPTQIVAIIYLLCSLVILMWVFYSHHALAGKLQTIGGYKMKLSGAAPAGAAAIFTIGSWRSRIDAILPGNAPTYKPATGIDGGNQKAPTGQGAGDPERLISAAGLTVSYLLAIFLIYYLTCQIKVWKWPIQPVVSLSDAYGRIIFYSPVMLISAGALALLKKSREPLRPWFQWNRFSYLFLIALAASIGYTANLLVFKETQLRGAAFWPPVIVLSLMNACSEEIMYRLALYRMIRRANYSDRTASIVQSLTYALIHFMVVGALFGLLSLIYGYLLGLLVRRSNSIGPAIACHFIVDIGCIGMPLLRI